MRTPSARDSWTFETLTVAVDAGVLVAEIAAPPMNLLGPEFVRDLIALIGRAEADTACSVLVFTSADPDSFISHVDLTRVAEYRAEAAKLTGEASIASLFRHLSASRLVTISQIEGRVRGAGSEFVLACDMRFAARDTAIFGQIEPAFGLVPGGGGAQYLVRVMGRARALEVLLSADDTTRTRRALRLDQPGAAGRHARGVRRGARAPDRRISGRRPCRGQGARQLDLARAGGGLPPRLGPVRGRRRWPREPTPDRRRLRARPTDPGGRARPCSDPSRALRGENGRSGETAQPREPGLSACVSSSKRSSMVNGWSGRRRSEELEART